MKAARTLSVLLALLAGTLLYTSPLRAQLADAAIEQAVIAGRVASPEDFQGVLVVCNGAPVAATAGLNLAAGCIVESGPTEVIATINGNEIEVIAEPGTQFDFLPEGIRVVIGQVFLKVRTLTTPGWFKVETTHGIGAVRSTQFDVQVTPGRAVFRLLEGALHVSAFDTGQQADIVPGQRAEIVERRVVSTARMSRAEIRAIVERVRRTERVLLRAATTDGSYVGLLVPDPGAPAPPRIESFTADGNTLRWRTRDAVRVEIPGLGRVSANGSRQVQPSSTTRYTLIATGEDGSTLRRVVTVQVAAPAPPRIESFTADGNTLRWRTRDALRVEISGLGRVSASGSRQVQPSSTTRYTLIATGEDGSTLRRVVTVQVAAAAPPVINVLRWDGKVLLWSVSNASRVSITGLGTVPASGSREVPPGSYTLTAYNNLRQSRSQTVLVPQPPPSEPRLKVPTDEPRSGGIINRIPRIE